MLQEHALSVALAAAAAVVGVIGIVLLCVRHRVTGTVSLIRAMPTTRAAWVAKLKPWGLVEVKGTLRCADPLQAKLSHQWCAYYEYSVEREYQDPSTESDRRRGSQTHRETISEGTEWAPFEVEDPSGRVPVEGAGAEVDAKVVVDAAPRTGNTTFSINIMGVTFDGGEQTIGYRYRERILPVNAPVYVLGVVRPGGVIGAPVAASKGKKFLVSSRTEEALRGALKWKAFWLWMGAALAGISSAGLGSAAYYYYWR